MFHYKILLSTLCGKFLKKPYRISEFKISGRTLDNEFELPGGSYSVSDILNILNIS